MPNRISSKRNQSDPKRIIAFAGRKQSGKNSAANFVSGMMLYSYSFIDNFKLSHDGIIIDGKLQNINDIAPNFIKIYHWADELKGIVSSIFNIDLDLLYGNDEDKNTKTHILWEDMPGVITNKKLYSYFKNGWARKVKLMGNTFRDPHFQLIFHENGPMTIREILQFFGTDVCRSIYGNCWVSSLKNRMIKEAPTIALIADTRFDNECIAVKSWKGMCVYMARKNLQDSHSSENGIKTFEDWDAIIHNEKADDIPAMHEVFFKGMKPAGILGEVS